MGSQEYQLLLLEAPDVPPAELKAAVRWRIKDLIGFHIDDAVIDVFEIPGQYRAGQSHMMYAVVARSKIVQERVGLIENSATQLEIIDIPEMCLRNVTALTEEDVQGVALLYLARKHGLVIFTRQHTLYLARKLDIGSDALADAAAGGQGSAALDNLLLEIQRSLDYYDSHFSQPPISALLLAPSESPLPHLQPYLAQNLSVAVRKLELAKLLQSPDTSDEAIQARCLNALGAALRMENVAL